jgi:hypothetical protein
LAGRGSGADAMLPANPAVVFMTWSQIRIRERLFIADFIAERIWIQ